MKTTRAFPAHLRKLEVCTYIQAFSLRGTPLASPQFCQWQGASSALSLLLSQLASFPLSCCGTVYHPLRLPEITPRCLLGYLNDLPRYWLWLLSAFACCRFFKVFPLFIVLPFFLIFLPMLIHSPLASLFDIMFIMLGKFLFWYFGMLKSLALETD